MKFLDDIKTQIPMQKIQDAWIMAKGKIPTIKATDYPGLADARFIIKRIHFLLAENSSIDLGKQEIFKREVKQEDGSTKTYAYIIDFTKPDQIKRLRDILTELIDLSDEDANKKKKEAIPGYLDYIAMASA